MGAVWTFGTVAICSVGFAIRPSEGGGRGEGGAPCVSSVAANGGVDVLKKPGVSSVASAGECGPSGFL